MTEGINKIILKTVNNALDKAIDSLEGSFVQLNCDLYKNEEIKKEFSPRINNIIKDVKTLKKSLAATHWRTEKGNIK